MTDDERQRWNERYASGEYQPRQQPSPFLVEWLPRIPRGRALDVATGTGRNALLLAEEGFDVDAVDISPVAIEVATATARDRGLDIDWRAADLDDLDLPPDTYDLVTVMRYRNPSLWPRLVTSLTPDGWIVIEHHLRTDAAVAGPRDPSFRVETRELLDVATGLRVLHYSEALETADLDAGTYAIARLVACKGDPGY